MDSEIENSRKKRKCKKQEDDKARKGMDDLPNEISLDILSRLPIASLIQSRFVCRAWNMLSFDPQLVNLHLSRTHMNSSCLIFHTDYPIRNQLYFFEFTDDHYQHNEKVRRIHVPFVASMPEFNVIGSCNGLLCLSDSLFNETMCVYNPFTGNYTELAACTKFQEHVAVYGFGFHPITNEYKVVKITYYGATHGRLYGRRVYRYPCSEVQICSLHHNAWRSLGKAPYQLERGTSEALVNGRLHWVSRRGIYNRVRGRIIISFDVADEQFREVPIPACDKLRRYNYQVAVLGGCLSAGVYYSYDGKVEIWVMKEYDMKESWIKEYNIGPYSPEMFRPDWQQSDGIWKNAFNRRLVRAICVLKNGDILVECNGGALVSYDPKSGNLKNLVLQEMPHLFRSIVHVGSLNWIDV